MGMQLLLKKSECTFGYPKGPRADLQERWEYAFVTKVAMRCAAEGGKAYLAILLFRVSQHISMTVAYILIIFLFLNT